MSDELHDASRPANRPKGMGWWPEEQQRDYCKRIYERGDRDDWLLLKLVQYGELSRERARADYQAREAENGR